MTHRLFFALWPTDDERAALVRNVADAVARVGGRPLRPEHLHATLVFLGSVESERVAQVQGIASNVSRSVCASGAPISLAFDRFDYWRKPQVFVTTATHTPRAATDLANVLKRQLLDAGFTPDEKPFRAHVTLARKVRQLENIDSELRAPATTLNFRDFSLVESRPSAGAPAYSVSANWPLCMR